MNAALWQHRHAIEDDEEETAHFRANNRALLDAMMRQIQSELRSCAPTEIAIVTPIEPRINPFLVPWKHGDPPLPWSAHAQAMPVSRSKSRATTLRKPKRSSRRVTKLAFFVAAIALGILVATVVRQPKQHPMVEKAVARMSVHAKTFAAQLGPTVGTPTTQVKYEPLPKVPISIKR